MPRTNRPPSYRYHKARDCAVVTIQGRNHYLGKYGSAESCAKYARLIAELTTGGASPRTPRDPESPITVSELLASFWQDAKQRYIKNDQPTSELRSYRVALSPVRRLYGRHPVSEFGPLALTACRDILAENGISRKRVNQHLSRIRRVFKWGVAREMVPEAVWRALCAVDGLRIGQGREPKPVQAVSEEYIEAVRPHVTPPIWAMIQFQLHTGCRPGEACMIRTIDLKMEEPIWEYRPPSHKTEHHGKERVIFIGPQAQAILRPWLKTDLCAHLFQPKDGTAAYRVAKAANRKTPRTPSQKKRQPKKNGKRRAGEVYSTLSYGRAVRRACERAGIPRWTPNQLRHAAATRIRAEYGIEAARVILGHSSAVTSEIYAEIDAEKAREIMEKMG